MNKRPSTISASDERPLLHGVDWAVAAGVTEEVMLGTRRRVRRRRQRYLAAAGAVGALALAATSWFTFSRGGVDPVVASARTMVVATPAMRTLPDGTVVELKDGAEIAVTYSTSVRRVGLLRGEAHFRVVKDAARPFVVAVDAVEVRAVGTSFAVQRRATEVEVLVTTGRVAVDRLPETGGAASPAPQTVAMLEAGNRTLVEVAAMAPAPVVEALSPAEMGQRLAWRVPRLEFTRTPLAEAVPMINRHSAIKLALADEAVGRVQISGMLRVDNVESLFHLLEMEHGIKAERRNAGEVVLRAGR